MEYKLSEAISICIALRDKIRLLPGKYPESWKEKDCLAQIINIAEKELAKVEGKKDEQ